VAGGLIETDERCPLRIMMPCAGPQRPGRGCRSLPQCTCAATFFEESRTASALGLESRRPPAPTDTAVRRVRVGELRSRPERQ
jgi:hypothetical protein